MRRYGLFLTIPTRFKPGDPPPSGYVDWHDWAAIQHKSGLRQKLCGICGLWKFPQELSGKTVTSASKDAKGRTFKTTRPVCHACA